VTILITGINGFIGSSLANHFCGEGYNVIGLGRTEKLGSHVNSACKYMRIDITKPMENIACDYVVHAAANTNDMAGYDDHYLVNFIGTRHVIQSTKEAKGFIFISSSSVYNFRKEIAYAETDDSKGVQFISDYGKSKLLAEQEVRQECKQPFLILRPRAVYGPGDTVVLPRIAKLIKRNKLLLPSHITKKTSLTHIYNLIAVISKAVKEHKIENRIFNIADLKTYSLQEAITHLLRVQNEINPKIVFIPSLLWELMVSLNHYLGFNKNISRFGSRQMTSEAVLNIETASEYFRGCFNAHLYLENN